MQRGAPMMAGGAGQQQMMVLSANTRKDTGRSAQLSCIEAAKAISSIVRTTLGPKAMLKMLLDPMGGIVVSSDGHAILREIDVAHPAAKSLLEMSRSQDENAGDGTTSVIILAGEILAQSEQLLERGVHPIHIVGGFMQALEDINARLKDVAISVGSLESASSSNADEPLSIKSLVRTCIETKFACRWGSLISDLAVRAVEKVAVRNAVNGTMEVDVKRYARVEKIPGGSLSDCTVLDGVMLNKELVHPKMKRLIENPRIVLLDCPLEYKKGESQTNVELTTEADFAAMLRQEEAEVKDMCACIAAVRPDVVFTEKGVSDLAAHYLLRAGISVVRRIKKTDNNRLARVTGAVIMNRCEDLAETHVGIGAKRFAVEKIGDEQFIYVDQSEGSACTILLRGGSKDVLNEMERNLTDALFVARNLVVDPRILPGGGATEMALSTYLRSQADIRFAQGRRYAAAQENNQRGTNLSPKSSPMSGSSLKDDSSLKNEKVPVVSSPTSAAGASSVPVRSIHTAACREAYLAVAEALEVIPRTLAQNSGCDVVRMLTNLRAKHASGKFPLAGIDANANCLVDDMIKDAAIMDSFTVRSQAFKASIECAALLMRIDCIVSGAKSKSEKLGGSSKPQEEEQPETNETFGDTRDG